MDHTEDEKSPSTQAQPLDVIGVSEEDAEARIAFESLSSHRKARRRKKVITGCVVAAIAVCGFLGWQALNSKPSEDVAPITAVGVYRSDYVESVQASGAVQPISQVAVTPEVDGTVSWIGVGEGSTVSAGEAILTIKNDSLDTDVREKGVALRQAQSALEQARREANTAYNTYYDLPAGEDEAAYTTYLGAVDGVTSAEYALERAQADYDTAVARADKRTVTAPSSGTVISMNAQLGAPATGSGQGASALMQIADLSQMTVKVQVNEVDISKISVGQEARVTFSALPGVELSGKVTRISNLSSSAGEVYGGGVVTYDVELLIPEPVPELKPGMTASVEIMMQYVPDALIVPTQALMSDDGENYYVMVLTDPETQAAERRDVTVGLVGETSAVVESGLSEGDMVILDLYTMPADDAADNGVML